MFGDKKCEMFRAAAQLADRGSKRGLTEGEGRMERYDWSILCRCSFCGLCTLGFPSLSL